MFKFFKKKKSQSHAPVSKYNLPPPLEDFHYEYVFQFLESPYWTNPIMNFLDQFCYIMEYEESCKKEDFQRVFENFQRLKDEIVNSLLLDLQITFENFETIVKLGLKNSDHNRVFNQINLVNDINNFKKLMKKRNKELNKEIQKLLGKEKEISIEKNVLEEEELELAIQESIELEKKNSLIKTQEEKEIEEIIRISEMEYQEFIDNLKKQQEIQMKSAENIQTSHEENKIDSNSEKKIGSFEKIEENENIINFEIKKDQLDNKPKNKFKIKGKLTDSGHKSSPASKLKLENERKEEENLNEHSKSKKFKELIDLKEKNLIEIKKEGKIAPLSINPLFEGKENLIKYLEKGTSEDIGISIDDKNKTGVFNAKIDDDGLESIYARKQRLLKQRELLVQKKNKERNIQLKEFSKKEENKESKTEILSLDEVNISEKDKIKRSNIFKKFNEKSKYEID